VSHRKISIYLQNLQELENKQINKNLFITEPWQRSLLSLHRWLSALFAATPFHTADHVIRTLNINKGASDLNSLEIAREDLLKFCLLFTPDSEVHLELNALWEANKQLAASLSLVLISPRFVSRAPELICSRTVFMSMSCPFVV
jgi:hypothetical protein